MTLFNLTTEHEGAERSNRLDAGLKLLDVGAEATAHSSAAKRELAVGARLTFAELSLSTGE